MNESLKPAAAAVDAAPIRKLCPEKLVKLAPTCERASRKCEIGWVLLNGVPSQNMNNGPGVDGRIDRYANTAATGHRVVPVRPK